MGESIIARRGGAGGLEKLAAVKNWSNFGGLNPYTQQIDGYWVAGSTGTVPADKLCIISFGSVGLILIVENGQMLLSIGADVANSGLAASVKNGKVTLTTNNTGNSVMANIGTN